MAINRKHIDNIYNQRQSLRDRKMLNEYFEDEDLNEEVKGILQEQWKQFEPQADVKPELDHVFHKLYYTINKSGFNFAKSRTIQFRIAQIAAILVVGIFIAASIYVTRRTPLGPETQQIEFVSTTGFRNKFTLPDGTSGWLGAGSELKYQVDARDRRIVKLNGLAYFEVVHNNTPFIVQTPKNLDVEVKGTRFNVSAYSSNPTCEVVLERGRVMLSNTQGINVEMKPNERVVYHQGDNTLFKSQVNSADFTAWIEGRLVLKDISLKEACLKLGRFYHVDFELNIEDSKDEKVRLVLEDESLEEALNLLSVIVPVTYKVVERKPLEDSRYSPKKIIITNRKPM